MIYQPHPAMNKQLLEDLFERKKKNNICFVYYSQGRDRWFGQVDPAPAADDWIGRFSFDILPMTDNTKLTASVIFAVFYR